MKKLIYSLIAISLFSCKNELEPVYTDYFSVAPVINFSQSVDFESLPDTLEAFCVMYTAYQGACTSYYTPKSGAILNPVIIRKPKEYFLTDRVMPDITQAGMMTYWENYEPVCILLVNVPMDEVFKYGYKYGQIGTALREIYNSDKDYYGCEIKTIPTAIGNGMITYETENVYICKF